VVQGPQIILHQQAHHGLTFINKQLVSIGVIDPAMHDDGVPGHTASGAKQRMRRCVRHTTDPGSKRF